MADGGFKRAQDPSDQMKGVFNDFYRLNKWHGGLADGTRSGRGSTLDATRDFRSFLVKIVAEHGIGSIFDAPCGDFHWMKEVELPETVKYLGGDIASDLVAELNSRYGDERRSFRFFDIVTHEFPAADLWICRDCFIHLPLDYCLSALRNACRANIQFAILSSHYDAEPNRPGHVGGARPINLLLEPFNLPHPIAQCDEFVRSDGKARKYQGLWRIVDIRKALGL